ncbi:hypothetical protein TMatcc_004118 [Talaromyces marneffei ATCC 18224]|uniref:BZIP domain-containing protein n=2 Tax=Talaromyces marneffei TaxID=37727 RepID=B6Q6F0_TALMQ|nr:uncharacterized protein EYB26_000905 [Talaromyces marneffei]EEA27576.1 conserved hypothetical protein [Talaromyces marneffei ATCC 18224]KAE8556727.1 hypothetical protein EYB25_001431 [Talaromyces marneffei]QGA13258.1 hypothetical protein EYB26_000905 [Talaromyces marneffei]
MSCKYEDANERLNRLARVRENQRKSRARRQQYIEELEQKVAVYKAQAQQREIEHLIALQKLEAENTKLRELLQRAGLAPGIVEDFLKDVSQPTVSEKIAIPRLKAPISPHSTSSQCSVPTIKADEPYTPISSTSVATACNSNVPSAPASHYPIAVKKPDKCCTPASSTSINAGCNKRKTCAPPSQYAPTAQRVEESYTPTSSTNFEIVCNNNISCTQASECVDNPTPKPLEPPVVVPADPVTIQQQKNIKLPSIASLCDCGPESTSQWPKVNTPMNTTLCEVAQDLIDQYNTKGVDLNLIKQRLSAGFRNGDGAGCRVQNNVLFEVLDEISGDAPMSGGT